MRKLVLALPVIAVAITVAALLPRPVIAQSSRLVIATGLDNPRGLAFGPDGALYVAEAGRGGTSSLCVPQPDAPPPAQRCYGPSGAITRILAAGDQRRVVVGLPSLAGPTGAQAAGPVDVGFGMGAAWAVVGFAGNPAARAVLEAAGVRMGRLVRIDSTGQWTDVIDISAHEAANNPDGTTVDSNPYGLLVLPDRAVVADAGANALIGIAANGTTSTLATFPAQSAGAVSYQSVPTTVVRNPNGGYLVGELTGLPFLVGAARVYQVPATGGTPVVVASGFTNIIDIAVDASGGGYVLEHDADGIFGPGTAGRLIRVAANGTQTVLTNANLTKPGGIAIGPDGALYVTNNSIFAGSGEVVRLTP